MAVNRIFIGIQARSKSTRFPKKIFEKIGDKTVIRHVIDACNSAAAYVNRTSFKSGIVASTVVLCPHGDEVTSHVKGIVDVFEGDENDVLSRYADMSVKRAADFVVRITSDCPLVPPFLIAKTINTAVLNNYDYCSNVFEEVRTSADGFDVEVISKRALLWLSGEAKLPSDKEHVTTLLRREPPTWAKFGHIIGYLNQSDLKLSLDTVEDLERIRFHFEKTKNSIKRAEVLHGPKCVHRF